MNILNQILIIIILLGLLYYLYNLQQSENFNNLEEPKLLENFKNIKDLKILLNKVHTLFEKNNIKYWMCSNTLLGAVKNKGLIPWDDEAHLSVMESQVDKILKLRIELQKNNLGITEWFGGYKIFELDGIKIPGKQFLYPFVDILVCTEENNKIIFLSKSARKLWKDEFFYVNELYPLRLYDFENFKLYGPKDFEKHLTRIYEDVKNIKGYYYNKSISMDKYNLKVDFNKKRKPFLWQYWDNIDGKPTPAYISLCLKTVDKHCRNSFEVIRLNKDNIYDYIPEIAKYKAIMEKLIIAHKVDIYRILLLYKYGGLYMDADIIVLKDPIEIMDKLEENDFVGFGCTGDICKLGYGEPSNWILAARPNSILMEKVLQNIVKKLNNTEKFEYHDLGKVVLWEELATLIKDEKYSYFHYPNKVDGSRDKNGFWIDTDIVFSSTNIEYEEPEKMLFYVFYNSGLTDNIKKMSEEELLAQDWNYSRFMKRALN